LRSKVDLRQLPLFDIPVNLLANAEIQDPRRQEGLQAARATMADIYDGPPEFVDLDVIEEWTG
jgi:hypothetical protein